ncbi:hypothetical protein Patl1_11528 [Pistacia atlantica]|uniref:Uncharacterized protein n=1 Tax=Pistacia atlantica TaxID=434234 RepID=A0ACC1A3P2_9ROSI|nr:hypothetical protein Patl1_11528 [Pistacia atlantica]
MGCSLVASTEPAKRKNFGCFIADFLVGLLLSFQEKSIEKWLYGLDDIKEAAEIIIVEGEMDKLAMEEAGFLNCASVPCGALQKASAKELPPQE